MPDHEPTTEPTVDRSAKPTHRLVRRRTAAAAGAALLTAALTAGGVYAAQAGGPDTTTSPVPSAQGFTGSGRFAGPPTAPRARGRLAGSSYAQESSGDATAAQARGLVEISSTLVDGTARGTGIVLSSAGTVVTNHHVVAGATAITVTDVSTGRTYTATYVGGDATADVAVLRLQGATGLTPASLATTPAVVGDAVTAVGDAGGDGGTLTASPGTVTALDQNISVQDEDGGSSRLSGLIEVHAYVVPGDSGGAVLDSAGEVVGMNVAASSGSSDVTGYAIPVQEVTAVAEQILSGEESSTIELGYHGYLGVGLDPRSTAPLVAQTTTSAGASAAGIGAGDTITSVDGKAVASVQELRALLARTAPGDRVSVGWRDARGARHSAVVRLVSGPVS